MTARHRQSRPTSELSRARRREAPSSGRSSLRRLPAALLVVVLGAALLVGGLAPTAQAEATTSAVSVGNLSWGVRESFRNYIDGPIALGAITAADGATQQAENGTFDFPAAPGGTVSTDGTAWSSTFQGSVHFTGHDYDSGPVLDLKISNIRVAADGAAGVVLADVVSRPYTSGILVPADPVTYDDVLLATLDLSGVSPAVSGDTTTWAGIAAVLAPDGVPAFADFYPADSELDPLTVDLTVDDTVETTTTSSTTTTTTRDVVTTTTSTSTTLPVDTTPETPDAVVDVTGGYLDWGVKASFRNYIVGPIADGTITTSGGAIDNSKADGTFRFPARAEGTFDGATGETHAAFDGAVRFVGHDYGNGPLLDLAISNLRVLREATGAAWLVADVVSLPLDHDAIANPGGAEKPQVEVFDDVRLAALDIGGILPVAALGGLAWKNVPASLTEEGAPAFARFYNPGEKLDPVSYTLELSEVPDVETGTDTPPPAATAALDKTTVRPGEVITVSGAGFLPGEQVEVWLHSTPTWLATTVADASGNVVYPVTIPTDVAPGQHRLELRGVSSGLSLMSAPFTVTGSPVGAASGAKTGTLPRTGSDQTLIVAGGLLVLLGAVLALGARRAHAGRSA